MAIDAAKLLAFPIPEGRQIITPVDAAFYALSVGFGQDPLDTAELKFVDPLPDVAVVPSMALVLAHPGFWLAHPDSGVVPNTVLHADQKLELLAPLPTAGVITSKTQITELIDKGEGKPALMVTQTMLFDNEGQAVARLERTTFLRNGGGFGGSNAQAKAQPQLPERAADRYVDLVSRPEQALWYRLNGDLNPLHSDPAVASLAGFSQPILHGLGTFGMICRALLSTMAKHDPSRLKVMQLRFAAPFLPGETLRVEMWNCGSFRARAIERDIVVVDNGHAKIEG